MILGAPAAHAGSATWVNTGQSANWTDTGNWGGAYPGDVTGQTNADTATFNTAPGTVGTSANPILIDSASLNINNLTFTGAVGAYTIGAAIGGNPIYLTGSTGTILASGITSASLVTEAINSNLISWSSGGSVTIRNDAASGAGAGSAVFQINGNISPIYKSGNVRFNFLIRGSNTNNNTISGNITDPTGGGYTRLQKTDAGTWILSGSNNYTGGTLIQSGILGASSINALGLGAISLAADGMTAQFSYLGTSGTMSNQWQLVNGVNKNTAGIMNVATAGQTLTLTGNIGLQTASGSAATLVLSGSGNGTIAGNISGTTTSLTGSSTGVWTLSGSNSYGGGTKIYSGTVVLQNASALGVSGGTTALWGGSTALILQTDTSVNACNLSYIQGGTVTLVSDVLTAGRAGITQTLGNLTMAANQINIVSGTNVSGGTPKIGFADVLLNSTIGGNSYINASSAAVTMVNVTGNANSGYTNALQLTGSDKSNAITGAIIDSVNGGKTSVTVTGNGAWRLSGTSSYTGATTITAGKAIVSGSLTGSTALSVGISGTLEMEGGVSKNSTVINNGLLSGAGTVGAVSVKSGAKLAPGLQTDTSAVGAMTALGNVTFTDSTSIFSIRLGQTSAGDYDSMTLVSDNKITLNLATLELVIGDAFEAQAGVYYKIINGDASTLGVGNAIVGTFSQGSTITASNGDVFSIYYGVNSDNTGAGNDVLIVMVPEPGAWALVVSGFGVLAFWQRRKAS